MRFARFIFVASGLLVYAAASADPRTVNDGVYSKAQAKIGEKLYTDHCLLCHDKKYFRPILKRWEGQSLSILFTVMSTSMPENNPGFLTERKTSTYSPTSFLSAATLLATPNSIIKTALWTRSL